MLNLRLWNPVALTKLRRFISPKLFNNDDVRSDTIPNCLRSNKKKKSEEMKMCFVCQTQEDISNAHILKTEEQCKSLGLKYDRSNFLFLCGSRGKVGTCHHLFDLFQMSFVQTIDTPQDSIMTWQVVGGGHFHGRIVDFPSRPHRRALHAHFLKAYQSESLIMLEDGDACISAALLRSEEGSVQSIEPSLPSESEDHLIKEEGDEEERGCGR